MSVQPLPPPDFEPHSRGSRTHPDARRPGRSASGLAIFAVGIAGVLLGYLLNATGETSDVGTATPTDDATQLVADGASESSVPSTPASVGEPGLLLSELVPLLERRQLVGVGNGEAFRWRGSRQQPEIIDIPGHSVATWNDRGEHLAFLKYKPASNSPAGAELWLSHQGRDPQPIWVGASSFAWHLTEDKIAWVGILPPGDTWQLMWGDVAAGGIENLEARDLGIRGDTAVGEIRLVGYGEYGWVIQHTAEINDLRTSRIITVSADGTIAESVSTPPEWRYIQTVLPDGRMLMHVESDGLLVWTDLAMEVFEPAFGDGGYVEVQLAPAAGELLGFRYAPESPKVVVYDLASGESRPIPFPTRVHAPMLSADGEVAGTVVRQSALETTVHLLAPGTEEWSTLQIPGEWWSVDVSS